MILFGLVAAAAATGTTTLSELRVEHLVAPTGVDVAAPRFSWLLDAKAAPRGEAQATYQVTVLPARAAWQTATETETIWDSGVVTSSQNYLIPFAGAAALVSDTNYTWSVTITTSSGATGSASSTFRTGLFARSDWGNATWITGGYSSRVLRREFTLAAKTDPLNSVVYVSGIGYFELECNGVKIGDHELDIGWTDYSKRVLYTSFDLSPCLVVGKNVLGVTLGAGWFAKSSAYGGGQPGALDEPPLLLLSARLRDAATGALTVIASVGSGKHPSPPPPLPSSPICREVKEDKHVKLSCAKSIKAVTYAAYVFYIEFMTEY